MHVALAARPGIARTFAGADDVELLVVGRERQSVWIRNLILAHHEVDASTRVDTIAIRGQFAAAGYEASRLADARIESAGRVARAPRHIRLALVELAAIGRIGEPVAAVRMGHDV